MDDTGALLQMGNRKKMTTSRILDTSGYNLIIVIMAMIIIIIIIKCSEKLL